MPMLYHGFNNAHFHTRNIWNLCVQITLEIHCNYVFMCLLLWIQQPFYISNCSVQEQLLASSSCLLPAAEGG